MGWITAEQGWRPAEQSEGLQLQSQGGSVPAAIVSLTQAITAAGNTILLVGSAAVFLVDLSNMTGGAIVLTSTPNMTPGAFNGQIAILRLSVGSNSVTIRDQAVLAGSGMRLGGAADKAIGARDSLQLVWSASEAVWIQSVALIAV